MPRLLFSCVNGTGLGHLTRTLAVARQVRRLMADAEILVLTSSENAGLLWREGFSSVKVPSIEVLKADQRLPVVQLAHAIAAQVVATFRPHVIVVDSQPAGMFSELLSPLLSVPKRVFIFGRFPNYFAQASYKIGVSCYDRILMPYDESEKGTIGVDFGERAVWVGDILVRSADEILPREVARRRLRLTEDALVFYVGLGGGGNPRNDEAVAWVLDALAAFPEVRVACAAQPLSKGAERLAEREGVTAVSHFPMMEYFAAFDVAISAAGMSCRELVHAGVPAIWVPLGFPSTDQEFNADRFAKKGLGIKVKMFDSAALEAAVAGLCQTARRGEMAAAMRAAAGRNGAEVAARAILDHLAAGKGGIGVL